MRLEAEALVEMQVLTPEEEARKAKLLEELKELEEGARARRLEESRTRKYSFADVTNPSYLDEMQRFQTAFGVYFPHLLDDEHETIVEYSWITNSIFGNPADTVRKSGIDQAFKKLRKAIQTIADHPKGYYSHMIVIAASASEDDEINRHAMAIFKFLLEVDDVKGEDLLPRVLQRYEEWAREAITYTHDRRNINWNAVHAVYRLRVLWWRNTGESAPRRALNPESPFANYLRCAFEIFEIQGDPMSAFKRWAALADKDDRLL